MAAAMIVLRLPVPPSTNNLYFNRARGRSRTKQYRDWLSNADQWFYAQKANKFEYITGPCEVKIRLPKIRGDISNRIKAVEDYLVSRCLTGDDKNNRAVSIRLDPEMTREFCEVTVMECNIRRVT